MLGIFEKYIEYFKTFATPKWIEIPGDAVTLYTLPLVFGKHGGTRTYQMPAMWERVAIQTGGHYRETKLEVHIQLENKVKVMDLWTHRCRECPCGREGCGGRHQVQSSSQHTIDLITTFHQQQDFGVTGLGEYDCFVLLLNADSA